MDTVARLANVATWLVTSGALASLGLWILRVLKSHNRRVDGNARTALADYQQLLDRAVAENQRERELHQAERDAWRRDEARLMAELERAKGLTASEEER